MGLGFHDRVIGSAPHLAAAIAALRRLLNDPLLLPQAPRRLIVEGNSAGGNFANWSVLNAIDNPLSPADGIQGAPTPTLPYGWSVTIEGFRHVDFKQVPTESAYAHALAIAYGEAPIRAAAHGPEANRSPAHARF